MRKIDYPEKAKKYILRRKLPKDFKVKSIEIIENGIRYYFTIKKSKLRARIILTPRNTYVEEVWRTLKSNTLNLKYVKLSDLSKIGKSRLFSKIRL